MQYDYDVRGGSYIYIYICHMDYVEPTKEMKERCRQFMENGFLRQRMCHVLKNIKE